MFRRSLKKQQKLRALLEMTGPLAGKQCLLVTCGDNNGALNWYFRERGGRWTWGDVEGENLPEMIDFLGEPVYQIRTDRFPFAAEAFDLVVAIDVLEHLDEDQPFLHELRRVMKPDGRALVTVPNGDPSLLANRIKWRVGMTPERYGHTRAGYTLAELETAMRSAGFAPTGQGGYSRFVTEMLELAVNYGFVFVLSNKRRDKAVHDVPKAHIAPTSSGELKSHGAAYRLYALGYPVMNALSKLDGLLPRHTDNAVIVAGTKA